MSEELTPRQRMILAEAGRAYGEASMAMVHAAVALSHDRSLEEEFTPSLSPDARTSGDPDLDKGEWWDLEHVREMLESLGNDLTARALAE